MRQTGAALLPRKQKKKEISDATEFRDRKKIVRILVNAILCTEYNKNILNQISTGSYFNRGVIDLETILK